MTNNSYLVCSHDLSLCKEEMLLLKNALCQIPAFFKTHGFTFKSNPNNVILRVVCAWQNPFPTSESAL